MLSRPWLIALLALGAGIAVPTFAQIPRTADGHPDFTGVWQPGSRERGTWEQANAGTGLGGSGLNPNAPRVQSSSERRGEPAPYKPEAAKKVLEYYKRRGVDDPTSRCLPPGVPRVSTLGLYPLQILQTPKTIVILYEYGNSSRVIQMNAKHPEDLAPSFNGNSVGRWEGDTLVVDVTGFNDVTWMQGTGTFHSEALHVIERYTLAGREQINYQATMEDPNVLTKPWTIGTSMMRREGTRIEEYICAENNLDAGRLDKLEKDGVEFQRK